MNKFKDFEQYLRDDCCDYGQHCDDDMPDAFDAWLADQDIDVIISYADDYAKLRADYSYTEGVKAGLSHSKEGYEQHFDKMMNKPDWDGLLNNLTSLK